MYLPSGSAFSTDGTLQFTEDEGQTSGDTSPSLPHGVRFPEGLSRPVLLPVSTSRESRGTLPGTSSLQSRTSGEESSGNLPTSSLLSRKGLAPIRFQPPLMLRGAKILNLSLARSKLAAGRIEGQDSRPQNNLFEDYSCDELLYDEVSREEQVLTMSDGKVVDETATTVVVDDGTRVINIIWQ